MDSPKYFVEELVGEIPSLASLLEEHVREFEEMLPHVFMGELTRYVLQLHNDSSGSTNIQGQSRLRQILDRLEAGFAHGEDAVKELIGVSFLENLTGEEGRETLRSLLGPRMSEALKQWD
jgi:hypothetical protein